MHFLAIVASERRNGNSDLLGRLAVRHALKSGVDSGEIVYLKDFELKQCRGCLKCLKGGDNCVIGDDLYTLLDIIKEADRMILLAPVYVLAIPGKLKMLIDRYLAISSYIDTRNAGPAVSVGVAALPEWHQFQLPLMNILLLALGRRVVESRMVYGAGPGEVLLDNSVTSIQDAVARLLDFQAEPFESLVSDRCPVDYSTLFEHIDGNKFRCPVCLTPAELKPEGYYFKGEDLNNHRWTKVMLQDHFENWITKTKPRFRSMLKDIVQRKKEFGL